jgi:hypothetical protein
MITNVSLSVVCLTVYVGDGKLTLFSSLCAVAMAIMGGYSGLLVLFKIKSAFSKKEEPAPSSVAGDASGEGMPAIDSPEFGKFLETERFTKMLESDDFGHIIEGTKA